MALQSDFAQKTINELTLMFAKKQINLEPGFQRKSVWTWNDRRRLMQSILSNYPLPSIFFYRRHSRGKLAYDVIDGKQRLEAIFMFTRQGRFKRDWFDVKLDLGDGTNWINWQELRRRYPEKRFSFESYKLDTVEVTGDLSEIVDLFVRINSTGKRLTSGEKRHATFYTSRFLKEAERLVAKFQKGFFLKQRILSQMQIDRMKGTELVAELLMSFHSGGIINKKTSLDRAIGNDSVNANALARVSREFVATLNTVKRMFPGLRETRFHNVVDFYSLFMVVWEMRASNFILHDYKRNMVADRLLRRLSSGVDELRDQLRKAKPAKGSQRLYADYLLTVQGDTDSAANRQRRAEILRGLLSPLFHYKDNKRTFSSEQRRLLWNSDEKKVCQSCGGMLTWDKFTVDHIFPYAKGGRATIENAQLLCRKCNSRKGSREQE